MGERGRCRKLEEGDTCSTCKIDLNPSACLARGDSGTKCHLCQDAVCSRCVSRGRIGGLTTSTKWLCNQCLDG